MFPELDLPHTPAHHEQDAAATALTNTAARLNATPEDLRLVHNIVFGPVLS